MHSSKAARFGILRHIYALGNRRKAMKHTGNLQPALAQTPGAPWLKIPVAVAQSGISRSRLYELIGAGKIRSVCIRERHQKKGTRLIKADSLWSFLDSMAEGGAKE